jgi:MFS family permease
MPKVFYGWYIVGAGLIINMLIGGLTMNAFGFYAAALKDEFGWSATIFGIAAAVTRVESGLLGPLQGWMIDRFGPRSMIRLGITTTGVGMILFGLLQDQATFIGFYILLSIGTSIGGFMTVSVAVVTWFERNRSRAIGFMSMGFTFGALISALVGILILNLGWRETSYATGVFLLIVGWGLSFLFVRHPADKGLEVDGGTVSNSRDSASALRTENPYRHRDFTAREALRTRAFWGLGLAHGAPLMVVGMWIGHGVLHIDELPGFSAGDAAVVVTVMVVAQLIGQGSSAWAGDRFAKRPLLVICMIGHTLGGIALGLATGWLMLIAFAVLNGVAWGARGTLITSLRADYFGASQFGRIMGWTSMVMMPFMTIGMLGSGILRDIFGSYDLAFVIFSIGAGTGVIWILMSSRPRLPGTRALTAPGALAGAGPIAMFRPNREAARPVAREAPQRGKTNH